MKADWSEAQDRLGVSTWEFDLERAGGRRVTGAVWLPEKVSTDTLICFGHGGSGDRYQLPIPELASRIVAEIGVPALSMDGPAHGLRAPSDENPLHLFLQEFQREEILGEMAADWDAAIAAAAEKSVTAVARVAYFGLSMGTFLALPFLSGRQDLVAAVLGLAGIVDGFPHMDDLLEAAGDLTVPTHFLVQLDDEFVSFDAYMTLFRAIAAEDKRLHANPGRHGVIAGDEVDFALQFLAAHIKKEGGREFLEIAAG